MSPLHALVIFGAGVAAGAINTLVGSGTLITFPTLLAFGYAPVVANISNSVGLVPGSAAGAIGYRRELRDQRRRAVPLLITSTAGGAIGAVLLLVLPASAFRSVVPGFIALAVVLIVLQPQLVRALAGLRRGSHQTAGVPAAIGTTLSGVYGGYFGAAQGILLLSILGVFVDDDLQRINALKVLLAGVVNLVAGLIFVVAAHVNWAAAGLIAAGSILGGVGGANWGRRLPAWGLRLVVVAVGVLAIIRLL